MKYEFTAYSPQHGAVIAGRLSALVYGPANRAQGAGDLASLIARGYTRADAGEHLARFGQDVRGFRVIRAEFAR